MRQPYTLTSSLEVGVPHVKNCLKSEKMANKKMSGKFRASTQIFLTPLGQWNKKNQGRQNCCMYPPGSHSILLS